MTKQRDVSCVFRFVFADEDADRTVQPRRGRLLAFRSGFENPHRVEPVRIGPGGGNRLALSIWFRELI